MTTPTPAKPGLDEAKVANAEKRRILLAELQALRRVLRDAREPNPAVRRQYAIVNSRIEMLREDRAELSFRDNCRDLTARLREKDLTPARALFGEMSSNPTHLSRCFAQLRQAFVAVQRQDLLLEWLYELGPAACSSLTVIRKMLEVAASTGTLEVARKRIAATVIRMEEPPSWATNDRASLIGKPAWSAVGFLLDLKYRGEKKITRESIFGSARRLQSRLALDRTVLTRLYSVSRCSPASYGAWERKIRFSHCLDHIIADHRISDPWQLLDPVKTANVMDAIREQNIGLLATFHGGYFSLLRLFYAQHFDKSNRLGSFTDGADTAGARDNPSAALFNALRSVQDGKTLLIAPDGGLGKRTHKMDVLGTSVQIGSGAPFIAFESARPSAWISVERSGTSFHLVLTLAPTRIKGERLDAFTDRWLKFYAQQIHDNLTGDPESLLLSYRGYDSRERWRD